METLESSHEGSRIASDIAIFVGGAIAGAIVGMLLAPRSGRALRKQLLEYGREAQSKGVSAVREASDKAKRAIGNSRMSNNLRV